MAIASFIFGIVQLGIMLYVFQYEYNKGSISCFLWGTLLILFGLPHFLAVLFSRYSYDVDVYFRASLFVSAFCSVYLLFRYLMRGLISERTIDVIFQFGKDVRQNNHYSLIAAIGLVVAFIFLTVFSFVSFGSLSNATWGNIWENSGDIYDLGMNVGTLQLLSEYLIYAFGGVIAFGFLTNKKGLSIVGALAVIGYLAVSRNRIMLLLGIVPVLLIFQNKHKRLDIKTLLVGVLAVAAILYIVYAIRVYRHAGTVESFLTQYPDPASFSSAVFEMMLSGDGELFLRDAFYKFIYYDNNFPNFNSLHTYIRLLLIALPTQLTFGLKPEEFTVAMSSAYYNNYSNTINSFHPTLFGDCFANAYYLGVLLAIFWAFFVTIFDRKLLSCHPSRSIYYATTLGAVYVTIARGSVYNSCLYGAIGILICWMSFAFIDFVTNTTSYRRKGCGATGKHIMKSGEE